MLRAVLVAIAVILTFEVDYIRPCATSSSDSRSLIAATNPSRKSTTTVASVLTSEVDVPEPAGKTAVLQSDILDGRAAYTGGLRLTGGKNGSYGIVEVSYDSKWGTICDDGVTRARTAGATTAKVICRLLGYPEETTTALWFSFAYRNVPWGYTVTQSTTKKIWLDDLYCRGNETSIHSCVHAKAGMHNCATIENFGVVCKSTTVVTTSSTTTPSSGSSTTVSSTISSSADTTTTYSSTSADSTTTTIVSDSTTSATVTDSTTAATDSTTITTAATTQTTAP